MASIFLFCKKVNAKWQPFHHHRKSPVYFKMKIPLSYPSLCLRHSVDCRSPRKTKRKIHTKSEVDSIHFTFSQINLPIPRASILQVGAASHANVLFDKYILSWLEKKRAFFGKTVPLSVVNVH